MTYAIGLKQFGITSIICDTRITDAVSKAGSNTSLKSGQLFPGCIYAFSGYVEEFNKFIDWCRDNLRGHENYWLRFSELITKYDFQKRNGFKMLVSSRHTGDPTLFLLDTDIGMLQQIEKIETIGSGKDVLDDDIHDIYNNNEGKIYEILTKHNAPLAFYPFFYCLWLMERVQGMEVSLLEKIGVGGIFHFLIQTETRERRQPPGLYVINFVIDKKKFVRSTIYRTAFVQNTLVVDNPIANSRMLILNSTINPQFRNYDEKMIANHKNKVLEEDVKKPFYNFCGFGFTDPSQRGAYSVHFTNTDNYVIDRNGKINKSFMKLFLGAKILNQLPFNRLNFSS